LSNVTWPGQNGRKYDFEHYPIGTNFNAVAGVYIFCKQTNALTNSWTAVYVGETEDFGGRLSGVNLPNHHRWKAIAAAGASHICVRQVPGQRQLRLDIETELRATLSPACNLQGA